jgi:cobalt transporter subunit CbtA
MIVAALVAGIVSGVLFSIAEHILTVPLIVEAETYENTARELLSEPDPPATKESIEHKDDHTTAHSHTREHNHGDHAHASDTHDDHATAHPHPHAEEPNHGGHAHASDTEGSGFAGLSERTLYTLLASVLTGITFSLLLSAAMTFYGKGNARLGLLWGLAGYLAFFVAPSLGLVPELPGTEAAAIEHRQLWWVSTVIATIAGLALLVFAKSWVLKGVGLLLLAIPHIVGAPMPAHHGGLAPEELSRAFMWMTAIANFIFWVALGVLTGFLLNRFKVINGKVFD